jgi:hypothetical protein
MAVNKMNVTQVNYLKDRVGHVAMCISGKIQQELEPIALPKEPEKPSATEMFKAIKAGKVTLKPINDFSNYINLTDAYTYNDYEKQVASHDKECAKIQKVYDVLEKEINDRVAEVHLESKRIIDDYVLGLVSLETLPERLEEFTLTQF